MIRTQNTTTRSAFKIGVIILILLPIALLHFVTGSHYRGPFPLFVNGYLIDILLPFGFYFLLCLNNFSFLDAWFVKGFLVFAAAAAVESAQYSGLPIFGSTFDPWDFAAYGLGVLLATIVDTIIFPRLFPFWRPGLRQA